MARNENKTTKNYEAIAAKAPTQLHEDFAQWIYVQTGVRVDLKTVQLVSVLRMDFQASPENQKNLAERKQAAAAKKKASAERKKAKLEAELAKLRGEKAETVDEPKEAAPVAEEPKVEVKADPVKLTILYKGMGEPEVHKAGCADIKRSRRKGDSQETGMFSSHTELTNHIYSDMIDSGESTTEDNYMAYDAKPCCPALDN